MMAYTSPVENAPFRVLTLVNLVRANLHKSLLVHPGKLASAPARTQRPHMTGRKAHFLWLWKKPRSVCAVNSSQLTVEPYPEAFAAAAAVTMMKMTGGGGGGTSMKKGLKYGGNVLKFIKLQWQL